MVDRVLVLGDDNQIFLATCRSLGRAGVEVHAAPNDHQAPALRSKYITAVHALPPYPHDARAWVDRLREHIAQHQIDLVIPTNDAGLILLQTHAEELGRERLAIPNEEALRVFTDKAATRQLATNLGIPVASATALHLPQLQAPGTPVPALPLVLKPRRSYIAGSGTGKLYAKIVRSEAELRRELARTPPDELLAEHYYAGAGVGLSVLARTGKLLRCYQHRRLRQAWETGPSSARVSEAVDPELESAVRKLAAATRLTGVSMFEFRRQGPGEFVLLEVNARLWGSLPLALEAGADFPCELHKLLLDAAEPTASTYRVGLLKRDMAGEYRRITDLLLGSRGFAGRFMGLACAVRFILSLVRKRSFDTWASDDPAPFHRARKELVGGLIAAVAKRVGLAGGKAAHVEASCSAYADSVGLTAPADDAGLAKAAS